ncbi:hypothetical protein SCHPADRAFT_904543 [Schizopora paradoxa]|uniref:Uncharacterized protein n=1 Tax=Schizopora paradoxa TaxID=27342 RepID=A0A0H2RMC1_9AGAM|nr:hypothetical protein SCHPADRAFT_904543 [Schizopora paradoxa]
MVDASVPFVGTPMCRPSSLSRVHPSASKSRCAGGASRRRRWSGCRPRVNRY